MQDGSRKARDENPVTEQESIYELMKRDHEAWVIAKAAIAKAMESGRAA